MTNLEGAIRFYSPPTKKDGTAGIREAGGSFTMAVRREKSSRISASQGNMWLVKARVLPAASGYWLKLRSWLRHDLLAPNGTAGVVGGSGSSHINKYHSTESTSVSFPSSFDNQVPRNTDKAISAQILRFHSGIRRRVSNCHVDVRTKRVEIPAALAR